MSDFDGSQQLLSVEEAREERIELLAQREFHYALAACIFTVLVLAFGAQSPETLRLCLSSLAGGFFFAAGYTRLRRNLAIARR